MRARSVVLAIATVLLSVSAACGGSAAPPPAVAPTTAVPTVRSTPSSIAPTSAATAPATATPSNTATVTPTAVPSNTATAAPTISPPPAASTATPAPAARQVRPLDIGGETSREIAPRLAVVPFGTPEDKSYEYAPIRPSYQVRFGEGWAARPPSTVVIPAGPGTFADRAGGYYVQDIDGTIHIRIGYWGLGFTSGRRGWSISTGEMRPGSTLTATLSADPSRNFIYETKSVTFVLVDSTGRSELSGWEVHAVLDGQWLIFQAQAELPELLDFLDAYVAAN